jgi:signal transduction histidine kinase
MRNLDRADAARAIGPAWAEGDAFARLEHEFRTPLAAIRAIGEILRDAPEPGPAERRALLDALLVEQARLTRTLEALLEELVAR